MTLYEYASLIKVRAAHLRHLPVNIKDEEYNPLVIAEKEIREGSVHYMIRRYYQNGTYRDIDIKTMILPKK